MKRIDAYFYRVCILMLATVGITACEKDNFTPPQSRLEGRLVYQGEPVMVQSPNVGPGVVGDFPVFLELWQAKYNNRSAIRVPVGQEGGFSALLFDGEYKITVPNGQGPFLWKKTDKGNPDSLVVNLTGSQTLDIEVTPYYMLRKPAFSVNGRKITGSLQIDKIITDANAKNIERVSLFINTTQFVDAANVLSKTQFVDTSLPDVKTDLAGSAITDLTNVSLTTVDIPAFLPSRNYIYARIGVKIVGVEDLIYTPVSKLTL